MLSDEIKPYIDKYALVSPSLVQPYAQGSDNGVLFTSQYLVLCQLMGLPLELPKLNALMACQDSNKYIHRYPGDTSQDAPDDYYGMLSMLCFLDLNLPVSLPLACCQPALVYLLLLSRSNPLRFLLSPLVALIIAFSNMFTKVGDTSNLILTWMIVKGTKKSLLCRIASLVWYRRLYKLYPNGMQGVSAIYFGPTHPFTKYWIS